MRYPHNTAESAELLRLTLPLITHHGDGYHPISYAIWYEFISGQNQQLRNKLDQVIEEGSRLDADTTYQLYRDCILDRWSQQAMRVNESLNGLIDDFTASTAGVDSQISQFGESLRSFNSALAAAPNSLPDDMHGMLARGNALHVGLDTLQSELWTSQQEIARLQRELFKLQNEVLTDPLTGLYNRRGLDLAYGNLQGATQPRPDQCSVIMIDIDHFKTVNDTYGHLFGDQVLRGIAGALRSQARKQDLVARFGGEEFVLILPAVPVDAAQASAEQVREVIARSAIRRKGARDIAMSVTISAGVTGFVSGDTLDSMLARADTALYMAKNSGRNRVAVLA